MIKDKQTILLVDDENDILEFLSYNLTKNDYQVFTANNGEEGLKIAKEIKPDLIILDVMMPQMDGIETCEKMREADDIGKPIIVFLTARSEEYSQIAGLEVGADDYITKPIKPKLFVSKVKSLLRRTEKDGLHDSKVKIITVDQDLKIDKERYLVIFKNKEYYFPRKELELLILLTSSMNKVFTRDEIFAKIWESDVIVGDRTIDVHIRKIREKVGNHYIETIKGVGYKFVTPYKH